MRRASVAIMLALVAAAGVWAQQSRSNPCDTGNGGLTLQGGFCASVVADNLGPARHMVVSPSGDLYVMLRRAVEGGPAGAVIALRDADGDGRFEQQQRFGAGLNGTDIDWRDG
jgi:glucose/arabinose dehydrogenase